MKRLAVVLSWGLAVCVVLSAAGCQTYGEAGALGAALGAGTGAIIGHQSGHAGEGAVIGAVLGGLVGLVAHDIKVQKMRSQQETAQAYHYHASEGEVLNFEETGVIPLSVRPGEAIASSIQYALLGTGAGVRVSETRSLLRGEQVMADLSTKNFTRSDGTWVSTQEFRLPANLQPGEYTLLTRVRTNQSAISARAYFMVQ